VAHPGLLRQLEPLPPGNGGVLPGHSGLSISRRLVRPSVRSPSHMRKLIVAEHISLDGIIQSPGAPDEDASGGFRLGGWIVPYAGDAVGRELQELFSQPFELLLGRRTYDIFAAYWPHVPAGSPSRGIAEIFNRVPKHVATHRSEGLGWHESRALE